MEITYDEFRQKASTYVLIGFGPLTMKPDGTCFIQGIFKKVVSYVSTKMKAPSKPIGSMNWYFDKELPSEVLRVKMSYMRLSRLVPGTIIHKGAIRYLYTAQNEIRLKIEQKDLAYPAKIKDHVKIPADSKIYTLLPPDFWEQYFCVAHHREDKYLIPATEILRACFGSISSAILKAALTRQPYPIYNEEATEKWISQGVSPFIVLRRGIPEVCAPIAHRMYTDKLFEKQFREIFISQLEFSGNREKRVQARFREKDPFTLTARYLLLTKGIYLVTKIEHIDESYRVPEGLHHDIDNNNDPAAINDQTKITDKKDPGVIIPILPKDGITDSDGEKIDSRILKTESEPLPTGGVYELSPASERITKEFLKTHSGLSTESRQALIEHLSTNELSGNTLTGPMSYTKEKKPGIDAETGFHLSEELYEALKALPVVKAIRYIRDASGKKSMQLVEKQECKGKNNWPYVDKVRKNYWKQPRRICVLELLIGQHYFYLVEVEKRSTENSNSLGIIIVRHRPQLTVNDLVPLKQLIIDIKGRFETKKDLVSNEVPFVLLSLRHHRETGETAKRVIQKLNEYRS